MKPLLLDTFIPTILDLYLCTNEKMYVRLLNDLKLPYHSKRRWLCPGAAATLHDIPTLDRHTDIICVDPADHEPIEIACFLVHEATHVWQEWCERVGEAHPGNEQEAYAIQRISQSLMYEFKRQTEKGYE